MNLFSQCPCTKQFGVYVDMTLPEWQHTRRRQNACLVNQKTPCLPVHCFFLVAQISAEIVVSNWEMSQWSVPIYCIWNGPTRHAETWSSAAFVRASRWKVPFLRINSWLAKGHPDPTPAPAYGHWGGRTLTDYSLFSRLDGRDILLWKAQWNYAFGCQCCKGLVSDRSMWRKAGEWVFIYN